ncbi:metal-dependent hydrolase [Sphingomonas sp. Leaf4]|uniref:metal-dependent hydrolase n=1 Tax=Sphingomonas sp. Leaf4 TaxID=2876553 RepID=UPI001E56FFE1|nr:metal-dependent hydrolase [Sphingomonas sp. Leaf4]
MAKAKTPDDLTITPRDVRFGRDRAPGRWWLNGDAYATAFYNALSVTFPKGEGYFIDSVRAYQDQVPPRLAQEIRAFVRQEAIHTREHMAFNRQVTDHGYDTSRLDARVDHELSITRGKPPIANLAATMALEHFTAILAHELVADPRHLAGGEQQVADLWRWHAIEEIEHKGVAYDTWVHATRDWSRFRRWRIKALVMLIVTAKFFRGRTAGMLDLLAQDGLTGAGVKWRLFGYAFGRPGMARRVLGAWAAFFLPGFHPWNLDDRALIGLVDSEFAAARLATA